MGKFKSILNNMLNDYVREYEPCDHCKSTGTSNGKKCSNCNGTGSLEIYIIKKGN